jgi:hypothetical protein
MRRIALLDPKAQVGFVVNLTYLAEKAPSHSQAQSEPLNPSRQTPALVTTAAPTVSAFRHNKNLLPLNGQNSLKGARPVYLVGPSGPADNSTVIA